MKDYRKRDQETATTTPAATTPATTTTTSIGHALPTEKNTIFQQKSGCLLDDLALIFKPSYHTHYFLNFKSFLK